MAGSARDEAERLVATFLARAAAGGLSDSVSGLFGGAAGSHAMANGSAECCVCPLCRVIATLRDPSPETAERLASSAGDIVTGVTGLMRAFSTMAGERPKPAPAPRSPEQRPANPDGVWAAATHQAEPEPGPAETAGDDPWATATAESAREAAAAAKARAAAAEEAVARAVASAKAVRDRRAQEQAARAQAAPEREPAPFEDVFGASRTRTHDVWASAIAQAEAAAEAEAGAQAAAIAQEVAEAGAGGSGGHRSVDHDLGASAPEDRGSAGPGDGARPGDAV
ncbi:hypothetical protein FB565_001402 [Actinoplanes lutulentus]|uniref:Uncharacterized protein n=1 Tax=Actinoplanes lutulentus TaxID=1287878 RepID=A0A327ZG34_9ACTN|nr:hypothetical protein [Actinoplanes lutulentus]MBB2941698.1 hypothetical protein [Actinoplanes lutulentus]RAK39618.1 hypothetical protein B0I29_104155 [Actinoplanes lutulentus]